MKLHWQILIALVLAVLIGSASSSLEAIFGLSLLASFDFIGSLFLNALKMIIVPLIVSSIIVGISNIERDGSFARMGGKTLLYYVSSSTIAIIIGLFLVMLIEPGIINGQPAQQVLGLHADTAAVAERVGGASGGDIMAIFLRLIPSNVIHAAAEGQMLGLIFFSLLFGYFIAHCGDNSQRTLKGFFQGVFEVMMKITDLVMRFAPLGVFALVAAVVARSGLAVFIPLAKFFFTVVAELLLHLLVVLPLLLKFVAGVSPSKHFHAMAPALLTAFSTSSSAATLPMTMDCIEKRSGVSNQSSSFVLPLGATINMDGTALYECVAALFIAQAYGLELGFAQQFTVVSLALMTSIGVAGIPSASLVAITIILAAMGLPIEGIGLILAVDRILDMSRTAVNIFSDSCGAVIIARSEGEQTKLV